MRVRAEQLESQLRKSLAPVYLVTGDVPLLIQEAVDRIRHAARQQGCTEREVYHADRSFDWQGMLQACNGLSLFSQRRLIELNLPSGRPGDAGGKALRAYCQSVNPDDVLLIIAGKVEKQSQQTKWFKTLDQIGVVIQIWPLDRQQLPAWLEQRMRDRGIQPSRDAVEVLADLVEGNLLAAAQEVDKLLLLKGSGALTADDVLAAVTDNSRYDVFTLVDVALAGDVTRVARILKGLRGEGVELTLLLWALAREVRALAMMAAELKGGQRLDSVLARHRVWDKRKALVRQALQRHDLVVWRQLLQRAACIDRAIKGAGAGNAWDELLQLALTVAGIKYKQVV